MKKEVKKVKDGKNYIESWNYLQENLPQNHCQYNIILSFSCFSCWTYFLGNTSCCIFCIKKVLKKRI